MAEDTEYKICGGKNKMKKTSVSIMYDDEKLNAIRLYMSQRDLDFKEELEKSVDIYTQNMFLQMSENLLI